MALARRRADSTQHETLRALVGDPALDENDASRVRGLFMATGALAEVERLIATRYQRAEQVLSSPPGRFPPDVVNALLTLARGSTERTA
uniref:Polyprenyl synthetase n=1 Tax=Streptomyces sp. NBC_00049 TaxID=2903617 RepID=A0AAU2K109_9ACTN